MTFGYWYGYTQSWQWGPNSAVNQNGFSNDPDDMPTAYYQNGQRDYASNRQTGDHIHALFIQDTAKYFQDRLIVSAGFKFAMMKYWFGNYLTHQNMGSNSVAALPRFSTSYSFNEQHQIYVNAQGDFRPHPIPATCHRIRRCTATSIRSRKNRVIVTMTDTSFLIFPCSTMRSQTAC